MENYTSILQSLYKQIGDLPEVLSRFISVITRDDCIIYAAAILLPLFSYSTLSHPRKYSQYLVNKAGIDINASLLAPGSVIQEKLDFLIISHVTFLYVIALPVEILLMYYLI